MGLRPRIGRPKQWQWHSSPCSWLGSFCVAPLTCSPPLVWVANGCYIAVPLAKEPAGSFRPQPPVLFLRPRFFFGVLFVHRFFFGGSFLGLGGFCTWGGRVSGPSRQSTATRARGYTAGLFAACPPVHFQFICAPLRKTNKQGSLFTYCHTGGSRAMGLISVR